MHVTLRKILAVSLVGFGIFCFLKVLPSSVTHDVAKGMMPGTVASMHSQRTAWPAATAVRTQAIKEIKVGQPVLAKNPKISNLDRRAPAGDKFWPLAAV